MEQNIFIFIMVSVTEPPNYKQWLSDGSATSVKRNLYLNSVIIYPLHAEGKSGEVS